MIDADVQWGLEQLRSRAPGYDLWGAYYDGAHRLAFQTERMREAFGQLFSAYALNLCQTVVDVVADRLQIVALSRPGGDATDAMQLWEAQAMPTRHGQVHKDALIYGDQYLHAWPEPDGTVRVWQESPYEVVGRYDPHRPGYLDLAVKAWRQGGRVRVTLYYADRIERYITSGAVHGATGKLAVPGAVAVSPATLRPLEDGDVPEGEDASPVVPHAWGQVPMVHLANNPGADGLGRSELRPVVPPQDALNKVAADLLVTGESHALPLRYLIGVEAEKYPDGRPKPMFSESRNRVVTLPANTGVGEWSSGDLRQLLDVKREMAHDVSVVSGIPVHVLLGVRSASDWPSGEALRVAEGRLGAKGRDRTASWGPQWAQLLALALRMEGRDASPVRVQWGPVTTPPSDREAAEVATMKQAAGIPREVTWREMGYSEAQIAEMSTLANQRDAEAAERAAAMFNSGDPAATGGL